MWNWEAWHQIDRWLFCKKIKRDKQSQTGREMRAQGEIKRDTQRESLETLSKDIQTERKAGIEEVHQTTYVSILTILILLEKPL